MSEAVVQEVPTERLLETSSEKELVTCLKCGRGKVRRVYREGFLQTTIFPLFGYYPWRCSRCGHVVMLHKRHRAKTQNGGTDRRGK